MFFYKMSAFVSNDKWNVEVDERLKAREIARSVSGKSVLFNDRPNQKAYFFVTDVSDLTFEGGILSRERIGTVSAVRKYLDALNLSAENMELTETTFGSIRTLLGQAERAGFIRNGGEVLEKYNLNNFYRYLEFGENILEPCHKTQLYEDAKRFLAAKTILPELDRIYARRGNAKIVGHPVHYLIKTDDPDGRREMCKTILKALFANKRLFSKRYSFIDVSDSMHFSRSYFHQFYKSSAGGAIIVRYTSGSPEEEGDIANVGRFNIDRLCEVAKEYQNTVLTLICLPKECAGIREIFFENLPDFSFIEIEDEQVPFTEAVSFLKMLAKERKVSVDDSLFGRLSEEKNYFSSELRDLFDVWYNVKLKTGIYPQYRNVTSAKIEIADKKPVGCAYTTLREMIGLDNAKKVIDKALNYYKAQKLFADRGRVDYHPAMHMIFTGNPGTAKTTVARLFAEIMRDNKLLSRGRIVECGRGDLVGKFVGWTAPTIQKKFREAEGGVLFIDEAYSLVDDRDGSFGDEAINTIVQEMENHRDNVIVIFAGYPDKMESFLQKNPGLRSRIAFHVSFDDYSADELCRIASLMAKKRGLSLTPEALDKLRTICGTASKQKDFGNGRFVRNVLDSAGMAQSERLVSMDYDSIRDSDLATINAEDIEPPAICPVTQKRTIGFSA